jgi:hypothetical protein
MTILVGSFTFLRRVAVTKKGYLAIVPPRSEAGDVVGIVLGAETPFVFRASEGKEREYALVGECYVHGIMDGEVLVDPTKETVDFCSTRSPNLSRTETELYIKASKTGYIIQPVDANSSSQIEDISV